MASNRPGIGYNNHDDILSAAHAVKPAREQTGIAETRAATDLVGVGQSVRNPPPMLGQQIGMIFGDVTFPLIAQFDLSGQIRASEPYHRSLPLPGPQFWLTADGPLERSHKGRTPDEGSHLASSSIRSATLPR